MPATVKPDFVRAEELFNTYPPAEADALTGADRAEWIDLAEMLAMFNEGMTEPGHCP